MEDSNSFNNNALISIGIIGNGFVGKATSLFESKNVTVKIYDIDNEKCVPYGTTLPELVCTCDMIFICVPTPMKESGECDTSIVEQCINNVRIHSQANNIYPHIVVRSTVPVGFCSKFKVNHMPEFLREASWEQDFFNNKYWIIGVADNNCYTIFESLINNLLDLSYKNKKICSTRKMFVDTNTSEFVKYGRNCFLAVKLSLCNEYYDFCQANNISYNLAIDLIGDDERIGTNYTSVPGKDGKKGWGGTCIPKDTESFVFQQKSLNLDPIIIQSAIDRNKNIDRKEKDWLNNSNLNRTFSKN